MPLLGTRGAASAQGFGEFAQQTAVNYIEDVFSTYLYTGTGASLTINNGIDLSGKGGAVWGKNRTTGSTDHWLYDTVRGFGKPLTPNNTNAQADNGDYFGVKQFNSNGFDIAANDAGSRWNSTSNNYVTWTFREQPKFFDVVTFSTGASTNTNLRVSHNLGSVPGCMMLKRTDGAGDWIVWHRSLASATNSSLNLNLTAAVTTRTNTWGTSGPTSTDFGIDNTYFGTSATYVAYLFAHDAGGFGAAGTDNVISCGSVTMPGAGGSATVTLGWEPQWVLMKDINHTGGAQWLLIDNMRGWPASVATANTQLLRTYNSDAESGAVYSEGITSTGFQVPSNFNYADDNTKIIYIAIRRGPMKTPTTGASVFEPAFATANSPEYKSNTVISGFDTAIAIYRPGYSDASFSYPYTAARLTGARQILQTSRQNAEYTYSTAANFAYNTGWFNSTFGADTNRESYMFKRAPGFHDVVCYTGTSSTTTQTHNLGVAPELMIVKKRSSATNSNWAVYHSALGNNGFIVLNTANASATSTTYWNNTSPTSSVFTVGTSAVVNNSGDTYVAYLFASCPGVSKVGSYTGTGANQTIDCGFASGVRWVLIKRTDTTGDWYVYDTTRGMTSGTDPYILLNSVAAEVTGTNYVETIATGFRLIGSNAGTNANGGTYIYLAIA